MSPFTFCINIKSKQHMVEYDWPIITKSQVSGLKIGENIISLVMTIRIVYVSENICKKSFQSFYVLFLLLLCVPLPSSYWSVRNEVVMIGIKFYVIAFFEKCICLCENREKGKKESDLNLNQICVYFTFHPPPFAPHTRKNNTKKNGNIILNFST